MTSLPSEATHLSSPSSGFARLAHASIISKKLCFGIFCTFPSVFTFLSHKSLLLSLSNLDFSQRLSLISQLSLSLLRYPTTGCRLSLPICKVICYLQGPPSFIGHCAFRFLGLLYTSLEANYVQDFIFAAEPYEWYIDLLRFGAVKHCGFGLGFERMVLFATGYGCMIGCWLM
ncbi:uncharacterized protein [Malus domestica]|uniref:uncharacterized protein isoform X1 n=1 Tax=Malus domestica TaxID=3750 RepID=UPI0039757A84